MISFGCSLNMPKLYKLPKKRKLILCSNLKAADGTFRIGKCNTVVHMLYLYNMGRQMIFYEGI